MLQWFVLYCFTRMAPERNTWVESDARRFVIRPPAANSGSNKAEETAGSVRICNLKANFTTVYRDTNRGVSLHVSIIFGEAAVRFGSDVFQPPALRTTGTGRSVRTWRNQILENDHKEAKKNHKEAACANALTRQRLLFHVDPVIDQNSRSPWQPGARASPPLRSAEPQARAGRSGLPRYERIICLDCTFLQSTHQLCPQVGSVSFRIEMYCFTVICI